MLQSHVITLVCHQMVSTHVADTYMIGFLLGSFTKRQNRILTKLGGRDDCIAHNNVLSRGTPFSPGNIGL